VHHRSEVVWYSSFFLPRRYLAGEGVIDQGSQLVSTRRLPSSSPSPSPRPFPSFHNFSSLSSFLAALASCLRFLLKGEEIFRGGDQAHQHPPRFLCLLSSLIIVEVGAFCCSSGSSSLNIHICSQVQFLWVRCPCSVCEPRCTFDRRFVGR